MKVSAAAKPVPGVCAVIGDEPFLRHEALAQILERLRDQMDGLGPSRVDGDRASAADVLDEVRTPSLLGDRRVVIVDDADGFISAHREALERYASAPADSGILILLCDSLPRNTRLYRFVAERNGVIHCEAPRGAAFGNWVTQRALQTYAKRMSPAAVQKLRRHLGDSSGWIDSELGKLASFVGDRLEITPADIEELTDNRREEKVFEVIEAMSSGDGAAALTAWEQVLATDRAAPGRAIAGLAYGVRQLLEARRELKSTGNVYGASKKMYTDAIALQRRVEKLTIKGLAAQQRDLLLADLAIKTGLSTLELAVEKFIVKHTAVRVPKLRAG